MQKSYKIVVAYDGTNYHGWQRQHDFSTIAGTLEQTFLNVFNEDVQIIGASRTDAGVHALGQVALFTSHLIITPEKLLRAWNYGLPPDIVIRSLQEASHHFHPQKNVAQKTYWYHVVAQQRPLPFIQRYCYYFRYQLDVQKLHQALQLFIGTHDFRSFCSGWDIEDTIRTIDSAQVIYLRRYNTYRIVIKGPGFLRYMLRRIIGACLEVASRDTLSLDVLKVALEQKDPEQTLPKAPAHGLMLQTIRYNL